MGVLFYLLAFNFPLLEVFNSKDQIFGIPQLVFYLFALWLLSIVLTALFVRRLRKETEEDGGDTDRGEGGGA